MKRIRNFSPGKVVLVGLLTLAVLSTVTSQLQGASCTPPPAGLVAWWPAEGNANDIVGGNNGILQGGATFASGEVGLGFRLDGTNGYVQIPDSAALKPTNVTVEAWVWLDPNVSFASNEQIIFKQNSWSYFFEGYTIVKVHIDNGNGTFTDRFQSVVSANGDQVAINSVTAVQRGVWYHVATTYDGNQLTLYVNDVAEASAIAGFPLDYGTEPVFIGTTGVPGVYINMLAGIIDEASIYNRALASNEIAAIYNAGSAGKCTTTSPAVPVISSFEPASGAGGTVVTISGNNFSPTTAANIVYFGAVQASVLSAGPTSLTVAVPTGATYAPITITVNGLVAYSSVSFEPTFAGSGAAIDSNTFAAGFNLPTPSGPYRTAIADLDGDGRPDVIVAGGTVGVISIYQNVGTNGVLNAGTFAAPVQISVGNNGSAAGLAVADVNGDGKLDLIVSDNINNQVAIFQNQSSGGLLTPGSFAAPVYLATGTDPRQVVVRDLDGDGFPDIICVNVGAGTVSIFRNLGSPGLLTSNSFAPRVDLALAGNSEGVAVGDLDGDGRPDLALADSSGFISLFRNLCTPGNIGVSTFGARVDLPAQSGSENVVIGDLDGDGKPELIASAYLPQTMSVYRNLSVPGSLTTNSFAAPVDYGLAGRGHTIALADFNGDGKPDIAEVTELASALSLFQNIGPGSFTNTSLAARVDFTTGWNAWGVAVGDLDGDGRPDVVFANSYDNTITIYQNQMPFGTPPVITMQPTNENVAVGDTAAFTVGALGASPLNYQWSFNGTNVDGATNATLIISNVQLAQAGSYYVTVSNLVGAAVSSNAVLAVYVPAIPPSILSQTPNQVVLLGNTATFSVNVSGSVPLSYFWQRNGTLIPGATNSSYALNNAQLSDSGSMFSCLVTNAYGSAGSTNVTLKVIDTIANDLCSGAIYIPTASYTNTQSTLKASSFGDPAPDCVDGFGHGVWYQFTAPVTGQLIVDTFGSDC